jgi:hypothetical protein
LGKDVTIKGQTKTAKKYIEELEAEAIGLRTQLASIVIEEVADDAPVVEEFIPEVVQQPEPIAIPEPEPIIEPEPEFIDLSVYPDLNSNSSVNW